MWLLDLDGPRTVLGMICCVGQYRTVCIPDNACSVVQDDSHALSTSNTCLEDID